VTINFSLVPQLTISAAYTYPYEQNNIEEPTEEEESQPEDFRRSLPAISGSSSSEQFLITTDPVESALNNNHSFIFSSPFIPLTSFRTDREIINIENRDLQRVMIKGAEESDREYWARAVSEVGQSYFAFNFVNEALRNDPDFQTECFEQNYFIAPLWLTVIPALPARNRAYWASIEQPSESVFLRYRQVQAGLDSLGITTRFRNTPVAEVEQLIYNRQNPTPDNRPLAVIIYPHANTDEEMAFTLGSLAQLLRAYRVLYYSVKHDYEFYAALQEATARQQASLLVIGAHGREDEPSSNFGYSYIEERLGLVDQNDETLYLDSSDRAELSMLRQYLAPDANIIHISCFGGLGEELGNNQANMLADSLDHPVWSANYSASADHIRINLNQQGLFESVTFFCDFNTNEFFQKINNELIECTYLTIPAR